MSNSTPWLAVAGRLAITLWLASAAPIGAAGNEHNVTGSGHLVEGFIESWQSIAVHESDDGSLNGSLQLQVDLHAFGLGQAAVSSTPTCLVVDGNTAWIGSIITGSTEEALFPVGAQLITLVRDLGGNGEDVMAVRVFPATTSCLDRPTIFETVVESGNLHVD